MRVFSKSKNSYANSSLDSWLRNTYLKLLDADVQAAIGTTKFYYTLGNGNNTKTTLQRAVFQLSTTELGKTPANTNKEGTALPIATALQIAYRNGAACTQWTRTPPENYTNYEWTLILNGEARILMVDKSGGSRPAFTLPATTAVTANPDGTYTLAA